MNANRPIDYFISYTETDKEWAEWLALLLEEEGYNIIFQAWDHGPQKDIILEMNSALETAKYVILLLSKNYLNSTYCQAEWKAAYNRDLINKENTLIPLMVENCELPILLKSICFFKLFEVSKNEETDKNRLLKNIKGERLKPSIEKTNIDISTSNFIKSNPHYLVWIIAITSGLLIGIFYIFDTPYLSNCKKNDSGFKEYSFDLDTSITFIFIPGGTINFDDSTKLNIAPFYISKNKLTKQQFKTLTEKSKVYQYPKHFDIDSDQPVDNISWSTVDNFCKSINNKLLQEGGITIDIPTEHQWLYASSNGSELYKYDTALALKNDTKNHFGILHMFSTSYEWCINESDNYDKGILLGNRRKFQNYNNNRKIRPKDFANKRYTFRPVINLNTSSKNENISYAKK